MEKTAVTVKIFNDEYTLKTDLPRTDVDAIAAMVDKKMQKLSQLPKSLYGRRWIWRESYIPYVVNMKPC
mgnify:CR=1 FL=1